MTGIKKTLSERLEKVEVRIDEVIIPKLNKVSDYVELNQGGINLSQVLSSKFTSVIVGGIVAAALYFLAKGSSGL